MKRLLRPLLLAMAATMLLCMSAFAKTEGVHPEEGERVRFTKANSGDPLKIESVEGSNEYFKVTATGGTAGSEYLLLVLKQTGGAFAAPTQDNIIFVEQATADESGKVTFAKVYPTAIAMETPYEAHVTGDKLAYATSKAAFSYTYVTYTLGDVDDNGTINSTDALTALQIVGNLMDYTDIQYSAADVTKDGTVNASDVLDILKYVGDIIHEFGS